GPDRVLAGPIGPGEGIGRNQIYKAPLYEFSIRPRRGHLHEYEIALPRGLQYGEIALSPPGDRLAWTLYGITNSGGGLLAAKTIELAVSKVDGSAMKVIGSLPIEPGDRYYTNRRLSWMGDGQHVTFNHGDARWSVPVGP